MPSQVPAPTRRPVALGRSAIEDRLQARGAGLVSVYLPTHCSGPEVDQGRIRLFWSHQDDALALFASDDGLRIGRLPLRVREFVHVGPRLCGRPLLPAVSDGQRFHVLALSRNEVRLYVCTRRGIREIGEEEFTSAVAEADRDAQRALQFHTGAPPVDAGGRACSRPCRCGSGC
jgi:hypothetical protein